MADYRDKMEPAANGPAFAGDAEMALVSIAVSLKRVADALDLIAPETEGTDYRPVLTERAA